MLNFQFINKFNQKTLNRDHTFFSNPHRHKQWSLDKSNIDPLKITDLSLQCIGYGQFHIKTIVERFINYLKQSTIQMKNLKNLRLKINGFDMKDCPNLIIKICQIIQNLPKDGMKSLDIQTTKLINCDISRDFGQLLKCSIRLGIKQRHGLIKPQNTFQTLILQFADWQFVYKGQKTQPNPQLLKKQLLMVQDQAFNSDGYCFKKFRLQLSTWYYTQKQSQIFFHSYKVNQFHSQIQYFVRSCYNNMPDLQFFQIDLRNWYHKFQLNKLKDILFKITKQGAQNMSINSKNISKMKKKKSNIQNNQMAIYQKQQSDDDVILFQRHFIV